MEVAFARRVSVSFILSLSGVAACGRIGFDVLASDNSGGGSTNVDGGVTGGGFGGGGGAPDGGQGGDSGPTLDGAAGDSAVADGGPPPGATAPLGAGWDFNCLVASDGALVCWGRDDDEQLGNGTGVSPANTPSASMLSGISSLSAGARHACAIAAGGVPHCWGRDVLGQTGQTVRGTDLGVPAPIDTSLVVGAPIFTFLGSGSSGTCGVTVEGRPHCWGVGSAGDGDLLGTHLARPTDLSGISGSTRFIAAVSGFQHACALADDGQAYCWGIDGFGQLGNGSAGDSDVPSLVDTSFMTGSTGFSTLAVGRDHACGLATDGVAYCWGRGALGSVGTGLTQDALSPQPVDMTSVPAGRFASVYAGSGIHSCGLDPQGRAYCWGPDDQGQLGNAGVDADAVAPVPVDSVTGDIFFATLALGLTHTCGLTTSAELYCWGENAQGQLGTGGTPTRTEVPLLVGPVP